MRYAVSAYLIIAGAICWFWAEGHLYSVGIVIDGRDLMGYVILWLMWGFVSIGIALALRRTPL